MQLIRVTATATLAPEVRAIPVREVLLMPVPAARLTLVQEAPAMMARAAQNTQEQVDLNTKELEVRHMTGPVAPRTPEREGPPTPVQEALVTQVQAALAMQDLAAGANVRASANSFRKFERHLQDCMMTK